LIFHLIQLIYQSKIQWRNFQIRVCNRSKFSRETSLDQKIGVEIPKKKQMQEMPKNNKKASETNFVIFCYCNLVY